MYKKIAQHPGTRKLYGDKLVTQGVLPAEGPDEMVKTYRAAMDAGKHTVDPVLTNFKSKFAVDWSPFLGKKWTDGDTAIPLAEWKRLAEKITTIPANVTPHQLVKKVLDDRAAGRGEIPVDWAWYMPLPRWWPAATRCACRARTAAAAPSRTATP